jgi:chemotaxis protein methyltransferase CheR
MPAAQLSEAPAPERGEPQRYPFTDRDFHFIRDLLKARIGVNLTDSKRELVYGRLSKRLRALELDSFAAYCEYLRQNAESELPHTVNAVTTNLTFFFREEHHFDYLRDVLLPQCKASGQRRLRIWSAGCSTGEEPYSIAMTLREALGDAQGWDARILATDIDTNVLDHAERGVYPLERLDKLPATQRRWFQRGRGPQQGQVRVRREVRELVTFRPLNLLEPWPFRGPFDAIFCRNVIIYFDKATKEGLLRRYQRLLRTDGHLFLGHSESLFQGAQGLAPVGRTVYRRLAESEAGA